MRIYYSNDAVVLTCEQHNYDEVLRFVKEEVPEHDIEEDPEQRLFGFRVRSKGSAINYANWLSQEIAEKLEYSAPVSPADISF